MFAQLMDNFPLIAVIVFFEILLLKVNWEARVKIRFSFYELNPIYAWFDRLGGKIQILGFITQFVLILVATFLAALYYSPLLWGILAAVALNYFYDSENLRFHKKFVNLHKSCGIENMEG